ncbi:calcium-binding protein [Nocardioides sp. zg-579]|uniref:Calcium-binding protein n=1 Tax=Nocardioides marmotae TaxID=2663857 RepID=A0A6I3JAH7_9ACTN|nr:excalibur calcium-binding domain-containing protein [Nocardioides marmotae]MCR6030829.1 calcium-binding protein [Gordonia jinghuaiqii]MTB94465.1 calcium-binding protein [Nocardioides marmotae]QKE01514.1 calcium-binding protein [Nocardioides marmotae]
MLRATKAVVAAIAVTAGTLSLTASPASAAVIDYANCDALHQDFKYGVARSKKAANAQVRSGHYRPAVAPKVYAANDESDADKDGTACEVSR